MADNNNNVNRANSINSRYSTNCESHVENGDFSVPPTYDEAMDPDFKERRSSDDYSIWIPENLSDMPTPTPRQDGSYQFPPPEEDEMPTPLPGQENGYRFLRVGESAAGSSRTRSFNTEPVQITCDHCQKVVKTKVRRRFDGDWVGLCCWSFVTVVAGMILIPCLCVWLLGRLSFSHYQHKCPDCGRQLAIYDKWRNEEIEAD